MKNNKKKNKKQLVEVGINFNCRPQYNDEFVCNTLRTRQNCRHFADDIFKWIFLNENARISFKISLRFVLKVPIDNMSALPPGRRQAIICTNDGWFTDAYMRHSATIS